MKARIFGAAVLLGASLAISSIAQAALVTVELSRAAGAAGWTEPGFIGNQAEYIGDSIPGGRERRAGAMRYTVVDVDGPLPAGVVFKDVLDTFCAQLGVLAVTNGNIGIFQLVASADYYAPMQNLLLGRLFKTYLGGFDSSLQFNAALQLAIWEITYDAPNLDLLAGPGFRTIGDFNSAVALAAEMLTNVKGMTGTGMQFYVLRGDHQDVFVFPVPEPGTLLLIGSGLLLGGALRRRRPDIKA